MNESRTRLILAFDGSCGQCRQISRLVEQACEGKLEVRPLGAPDVRRWREQALGSQAPWAPTLLRVEGDEVRAWVGRAMAVPLVRRLGLRSTVRVVRAFGRLRHPAARPAEAAGDVMGRKRFLQLGAGAAVVAGLAVTGQVPAFARSGRSKSQVWVEANMDRLPRRYADFSAYPMSYRRQIYPHLPPETKRQLWLDHLGRYRETAARLTPARTAVLDRATTIVRDECTFTSVPEPGSTFDRTLRELREEAIRTFGRDEANALLITLGPVQDPDPVTSPVEADDDLFVTCYCSDQCHDNCPGSDHCEYKMHDCAFITVRSSRTAARSGCTSATVSARTEVVVRRECPSHHRAPRVTPGPYPGDHRSPGVRPGARPAVRYGRAGACARRGRATTCTHRSAQGGATRSASTPASSSTPYPSAVCAPLSSTSPSTCVQG